MGNDWVGSRTADERTRRQLDDLLSVLAHRRRRELLYHVVQVEVTDVETLASKIAHAESGAAPPDVKDRIRTTLVHTHLPKLADASAVEFDQRSGAVRCHEVPAALERFLETCREIEIENLDDQ